MTAPSSTRLRFFSLPNVLRRLAICLLLIAFASTCSRAIPIGPFLDFKGTIPSNPVTVVIPSFLGLMISIPFDGGIGIGIDDTQSFTVGSFPVPVFGATYVDLFSSADVPFNPQTDPLRITDIFALDLDPQGNANTVMLTGFNANAPQIVPASPETFIGVSGTIYTADVNVTSTIGNLPALLPGFDLSAFGGDPNSIVYVAQTTVPAHDAMVPEPASPLLVASALGLLLVGRGRH